MRTGWSRSVMGRLRRNKKFRSDRSQSVPPVRLHGRHYHSTTPPLVPVPVAAVGASMAFPLATCALRVTRRRYPAPAGRPSLRAGVSLAAPLQQCRLQPAGRAAVADGWSRWSWSRSRSRTRRRISSAAPARQPRSLSPPRPSGLAAAFAHRICIGIRLSAIGPYPPTRAGQGKAGRPATPLAP